MNRIRFDKHIDIDSIPTLPAIAMEAIRLMEGDQSSFRSIADLLQNDQVLSGRILHYANSAFVGARTEITTIAKAISLLGFTTVRSIILSVSVFDCFSGPLSDRRGELVKFWLHSIGVAATAEILADKLGFSAPDEAYLAGLVHDIGKLVCFLHLPEAFMRVCLELEKQGGYGIEAPLALEVEEEIMGITHVEVGKLVGTQWQFPAPLVKAMWLHHQPVFATIRPERDNLHQLIRFADVICVANNIGSSYFLSSNAYDHQHYHFALENLMLHHHLSSSDLEDVVTRVMERVKELGAILGINDPDKYRTLVSSANQSLGSMSLNLEQRNRELTQTNRVLDATCAMTRRLKSGMEIGEAVEEVIAAVRGAFVISRCLCMVVDSKRDIFVGRIQIGSDLESFEVAASGVSAMVSSSGRHADMEKEAVRRLNQARLQFDRGGIVESGVIDMVSGSSFMASFFVADKKSNGRPERIIGELVLDFQGVDSALGNIETLSRNFQMLATAAGNGIERILLEKDLQTQAKELADASRKMEESQRHLFHSHRLATVGRLAAGAAHEINNPLTIISLNIQIMERLLAQGDANIQEIGARLKVLAGQEKRISKIIGELMGFARPTQPRLEPTDVAKVVNDILMVIGDRVSMTKIVVENQIPLDLPMVYADSGQIEQVIMNLLINANHAMPDGGRITLNAEVDRRTRVAVSVTDTGTGISKENLSKIFDPFFTTKREGEGTGLGLAICHSIVEHNGGALQVQSEEGVGSTFTLRLPVDQGSRLQTMKKAVDQKRKIPESGEECRILVVDDERLLNEMLQECLRSAGYGVDGAFDGIEGIGLLRYKKYHLIMLDVRMPRKDGLEVLKFVRDEYPDIPVIIITGLASMDEIKETVKKGAFACIKKPFQLDKVLVKVREALANAADKCGIHRAKEQ
ncbi:MAG: HDOD domain-containing protein [Proteobacteria bacterium]|nr:HDOD domain-containing protein [Desulfobulbaceae bacterium]MBU4153941.1 HDOD domain-containing protein [Pseudomonadota bacterium]